MPGLSQALARWHGRMRRPARHREGGAGASLCESGNTAARGDDRFLKSRWLQWAMPYLLMIQTVGSITVPISIICADFAVRLIDAFPGSSAAWYLHLAVFAPLERASAVPSPLSLLLDRAALTGSVLLMLLAICVHLVRFRLGLALLAHLAFAASALVARAWMADVNGAVTPSLLLVREEGGTTLVAMLLAATGLACALSHATFVVAILREPGGRRASLAAAGTAAEPVHALPSQP